MVHGPLAPASLRRLEALHRRHARRLRTGARWLGFDDPERDRIVAACFLGLTEHVPEDSAAGWAALMRRLARAAARAGPPSPGSGAEAALFGFLARISPGERAVFVLAELGGFDAVALARAIGAPAAAGQAQIVGLRRAFAGDPAVSAGGGPAAALRACIAGDEPEPGWQAGHWDVLRSRLTGAPAGWRSRATIAAIGALAVALLAVFRPPEVAERLPQIEPEIAAGPGAPAESPAAARDPAPAVPPVAAGPAHAPPLPLPAPKTMVKTTGVVSKGGKVRNRGAAAPRRTQDEALAERAKQAQARDPGLVIVELEMLGAARKALARQPAQALAYVEQHAREFPGSQLVDQRTELRVRALCALGRAAEARAEAQRRAIAPVQTALQEACR